ncbi:hypothetical protein CLOAM1551 [Candidatus Cloacimonas acidaminovorans str. Evry]|uniref:Uncharacterized protein n=1 Tax=Cloacimonas acidaminovorans (strain Evry) TaxID=459349 RepID=B0VFV6_CLOAI|nr:hypothetical protein CLOAM1551 [Candidatus Cloacimonas acidaminovorans str. Evry]
MSPFGAFWEFRNNGVPYHLFDNYMHLLREIINRDYFSFTTYPLLFYLALQKRRNFSF